MSQTEKRAFSPQAKSILSFVTLLALGVGIVALLIFNGTDASAAPVVAYPSYQQSPLSPLAPAPTPFNSSDTEPTENAIQPPLIVGRPANQTSLPLVAALLLAIGVVVALSIQRRR